MITYLRKKYGYSQTRLANLLGVTQSTVSMWENGENTPRPDKLVAMSKLFNCSIETLLQPCEKKESHGDDQGIDFNVGGNEEKAV